MKRSDRLLNKARRAAGLCLLSVAVVGFGCVGAASAMPCLPVIAFGAAFVALVALCAAIGQALDACMWFRASVKEARWEWEKSIRPRF